MTIRLILLLFFGTLIFSACGPDYLYEHDYEIPGGEWTYADRLEFPFEIDDTSRIYNLWLEIGFNTDYKYQNLYTRVHTRFPSGETLEEPLSIELADKLGRWYGDCNNSYCTLRVPIQQGAFFNQPGAYQITLEQFMRQDPVRGIRNIGFQVERTEITR
ncbi:MAG: gliding motility lipoprotein GldH [Lewinella sp.]|nr:gliding motility lipoprotein GldH [Lewinella sp.]